MKTRVIQVPIPQDLLEQLDAMARGKGESRASFIREACSNYVATTREAEADRRYEEGYRRIPEDRSEAEAMEAASAESMKDDPW